jgi:hypothetical protein
VIVIKAKEVVKAVNAMKARGIIDKYAIGGAHGANFYTEPVFTEDIDFFINFSADSLTPLTPIYTFLQTNYDVEIRGEYIVVNEWPIQFLPADTSPVVQEALDHAVEEDLDGEPVWIFTIEYLAAIALETGRLKDKLRLQQLLDSEVMNRAEFEKIVAKHNLEHKLEKFHIFLTENQ